MLPNRPLPFAVLLARFAPIFLAATAFVLPMLIPALDPTSAQSRSMVPFVVAVQGASPQESPMPLWPKAVLRRVLSRKPMPFSAFPDRPDALNFLRCYMVETLECGHRVETYFNPPVDNLTAKYRRCKKCDEAANVIEITAGKKKPPVSVGTVAARKVEREKVRL
jgi:hypothetical protein